MLSYQHDYHAGNHADVLKHWALVECVDHLQRKPAALDYIDTHAGSGWYRLDTPAARKTNEYRAGILRLMEQPVAGMEHYLDLVRGPVAEARYPGSPGIVNELLRPGDRSWLFELHPQAFRMLESHCSRPGQTRVRNEDGFKALKGLLPTASRRALVLIDPSWELRSDADSVIDAARGALRRMAQTMLLIWYPVIDRREVRRLERAVRTAELRNSRLIEISVRPDGSGGMTGSGLIAINPPWTWQSRAESVLPALAACLADDGRGRWRNEELVPE